LRRPRRKIFGGLARPRFLPIGTAVPDFARLAAQARELEVRYQPDRARALAVIEEEMTALGAEQHGGDWHYRGRPVTLRILIRSDDIRRQVGDYVANLMEDIGFRTERLYRSAEEASRIWIASDPAAGQWNIYTGSWVSILVRRDTSDSFDFYYTPRGRADPLWQAYDPDPEFDAIAERLSRGEYADLAEREDMMARALALAMRDSARVWLVDQSQIVPRAAAVQVAADLAGGVRGSQIWPLTLRFRDRVGGRMTFAAPSVLTEPWNPVAGTNWLFDRMVLRAINDAPLLPDPYTGLYRPQRVQEARLAVQAGSPVSATLDWLTVDVVDEIEVPGDTWLAWRFPRPGRGAEHSPERADGHLEDSARSRGGGGLVEPPEEGPGSGNVRGECRGICFCGPDGGGAREGGGERDGVHWKSFVCVFEGTGSVSATTEIGPVADAAVPEKGNGPSCHSADREWARSGGSFHNTRHLGRRAAPKSVSGIRVAWNSRTGGI
jgi:hypothetical protein